jgi:hypothetical protein
VDRRLADLCEGGSRGRLPGGDHHDPDRLVGVFALFANAAVATTFAVVQRAVKPAVALTATADQISLGARYTDRVPLGGGDRQLTKTIDRLCASMKRR